MATMMRWSDWVLVIAAIPFNLLIAGIFIARKRTDIGLTRALGILWLVLALPLVIVLVDYWRAGRGPQNLLALGAVLFYMLVEFMLDYVLRIPFRDKPLLHVPYIVLEYVALFCLIGLAFAIDRRWGYVVAVCFWIVMGSLIYLYWDKIMPRLRGSPK
jgi:hypothetical protein